MKFEKGGGSINGKPTCVTYGKRHYCECLTGTGSFFGCVKEGHKVRYCPTIASRGKEGKKVAPNVPKDDVQATRHFYSLWTRGENLDFHVMRISPCIYLFSSKWGSVISRWDKKS